MEITKTLHNLSKFTMKKDIRLRSQLIKKSRFKRFFFFFQDVNISAIIVLIEIRKQKGKNRL